MGYRTPAGFKTRFADNGIGLVLVRKTEHLNAIGIHLSRPNDWELERALDDALRDSFPAVYVHDERSWEIRRERHAEIRRRREAIQVVGGNWFALRTGYKGNLSVVQGGAA